ncbi:MAG: hypothetical protein PHE15_04985 [Dehalococcoidales bacterium]|nr:hypothetical protein [Dehalococcoidales bacterium]
MYALSIRQPWAWLLTNRLKDVENRDWLLPMEMMGERIYVHASKSRSDMQPEIFTWISSRFLSGEDRERFVDVVVTETLSFGAIIGEVTIIQRVNHSCNSVWYVPDSEGFIVECGVLYDNPIPCRGQLGFWKPKEMALK